MKEARDKGEDSDDSKEGEDGRLSKNRNKKVACVKCGRVVRNDRMKAHYSSRNCDKEMKHLVMDKEAYRYLNNLIKGTHLRRINNFLVLIKSGNSRVKPDRVPKG